ncbi:MAG: response regulator transcription factor [Firmicutes bacterium]|nr:response regulator transcription factor [Bacillota bacterium]
MDKKRNILIVEDEYSISNFISTILSANDYSVTKAKDGGQAMALITSYCPDVILLDLGLPDMDGLNIIKSVRSWSSVPIIVVSARGHEREKVEALDLGADDYITKPFGTSELLARIRTAIRHTERTLKTGNINTGVFYVGELSIDFDRRIVTVGGNDVHLTQIEFKILDLLSKYAGRVLTYDYIITNLWGPHAPKDNQILRVNMANIRRKLETNPAEPKYILTEVGVGYRMVEEV